MYRVSYLYYGLIADVYRSGKKTDVKNGKCRESRITGGRSPAGGNAGKRWIMISNCVKSWATDGKRGKSHAIVGNTKKSGNR